MLLPKKLVPESRINLVHTSSPVGKADLQAFESAVKKIGKNYPHIKVFDVENRELDPRYLAASETERLKKFRQAIKDADWIQPIYGGTGCGDIVRHLTEDDLKTIRENRPIVNGFSDTTFLINHLYLELDLLTFHYSNACGLHFYDNSETFFDVVQGKTDSLSYREPGYFWLTEPPEQPVKGTALGGNFETFRDMLDVMRYGSATWKPFILFMEDIGIDAEDFHRIIISLDQRKIFKQIRAIVIGRMDERSFETAERRFNTIFGQPNDADASGAASGSGDVAGQKAGTADPEAATAEPPEPRTEVHHFIKYLISDIIEDRKKAKDPLYILKVDNFGHNVTKNPMIVPIGGRTMIHPDGRIEFTGPFVQ